AEIRQAALAAWCPIQAPRAVSVEQRLRSLQYVKLASSPITRPSFSVRNAPPPSVRGSGTRTPSVTRSRRFRPYSDSDQCPWGNVTVALADNASIGAKNSLLS